MEKGACLLINRTDRQTERDIDRESCREVGGGADTDRLRRKMIRTTINNMAAPPAATAAPKMTAVLP